MKILDLSSYYYPEQMASSHLKNDLEEAFKEAGYEVILYVPTPTRGVSKELRNKYKKILYEERKEGNIKINRFYMIKEYKNPIVRAFRYSAIQWRQYWRFIKELDADIVYCSSTPPTQGLLATLVTKKIRNKSNKEINLVYVLQDIFPESLVSTGLCKKKSLIYKIGERIANYIYVNASKIIVISEEFKQILLKKGVEEKKIEVIYNWVDENKVINIPREENSLFDEYKLDRNKFYVAYSGNIGMTQNMDMLLDVAKELQVKDDISFILVGDGAYKPQVEKRIKEDEINNVTLIPYQPYERISEVFSLGDIGLIISKKGVGSSSVPSKTWSYMSAERPILASFDKDSELCRIIQENNCGVCVDANCNKELHTVLLEIQKNNNVLLGKNGRKYILDNMSKRKATEGYVHVLNSFK